MKSWLDCIALKLPLLFPNLHLLPAGSSDIKGCYVVNLNHNLLNIVVKSEMQNKGREKQKVRLPCTDEARS